MNDLGLGKRLLRSSSAATFSQAWRVGVMFVTQAILRRLVAPDDWGFWHWAVDFLFLVLGQLRDVGTPAHVVRDPRRPYGGFLALEVGWGLLMAGLVFSLSPLLVRLAPESESSLQAVALVKALAIFLFVEGLGKVPQTWFEAEIRLDRVLWPELVRNFTYVVVSLWLAAEDYGVWSLVVGHIAAAAVFTAMLWWRAWGEMPLAWDPRSAPALVRSSWPLMVMAIVLLAVESVDYQILGLYDTDAVVGLYGGALTLASMVLRVLEWPLRRALYPTFVVVKDDPERFFLTYRLSTVLLLAIHVPVALFLHFNAAFVLRLVWGVEYLPAAAFLQVLAFMPLVQPFTRCAEDLLLPHHRERMLIVAASINLVTILVVGTLLTRSLGAEGMAWAKLLPLGSILLAWEVRRVDPRGFRRLLVDILVVYGVGAFFYAAAAVLAGDALLPRFLLSIVAGGLSVLATAALFGRAFRDFLADVGRS